PSVASGECAWSWSSKLAARNAIPASSSKASSACLIGQGQPRMASIMAESQVGGGDCSGGFFLPRLGFGTAPLAAFAAASALPAPPRGVFTGMLLPEGLLISRQPCAPFAWLLAPLLACARRPPPPACCACLRFAMCI